MIELAAVGDVIACKVTYPRPSILSAKLSTPEACAMGNELLLDESSGWWLVKTQTDNTEQE